MTRSVTAHDGGRSFPKGEPGMRDRDLDVPLHARVRAHLLDEIESGNLRPGDQVPTEPQLIDRFQVSRTTVRRALRDLEMMGLIDRQPGRGSFVREPHLEPRLDRLTGFVEDMQALGLNATAQVVTIERVPAPIDAADALGLDPGDETVHIERIRLGNGQPITFDSSYLRPDLGNRIAQENLEVEPFYSILETKYGIRLSGADYVVTAISADERLSRLLQIPLGAAVLQLDRLSRSAPDSQPIIFEHLHYRGDRIRYRLTLDR
jgi:GntR family transcriptional regulator